MVTVAALAKSEREPKQKRKADLTKKPQSTLPKRLARNLQRSRDYPKAIPKNRNPEAPAVSFSIIAKPKKVLFNFSVADGR